MYCEVYRCKMSEAACVVRRRNALSNSRGHVYKPGYSDHNCANCKIGAELTEKLNPKEVTEYSAKLSTAQHNAMEFFEQNKERKKHGLDPLPVLPPRQTPSIQTPATIARPKPEALRARKTNQPTQEQPAPKQVKRRGRPPGSKNAIKPKKEAEKRMVSVRDMVLILTAERRHYETRIKHIDETIKVLTR